MDREPTGSLLQRLEQTLPSRDYFDPDHHRRELHAIWYRSWVCVGRVEEVAQSRDYKVVEVGDQGILVTRDLEGHLRAFHNSCRHRGSLLCSESQGRFRGGSIVCPYHGWTYSLAGELLGARHQLPAPGFEKRDYSLHAVAVDEWAGSVFVNLLGAEAPPLHSALGEIPARFAPWSLETLRVGKRLDLTLACNWKVFWENFSECFHCPGVHPELCQIVPVYGRGLMEEGDDPRLAPDAGRGAPLAPGAVTWTLDGTSRLPPLPGLGAEERRQGQTFAVVLPSLFAIAHVDYVRTVRLLPRGAERTGLIVEWLFEPATLERSDFDLEHASALGQRVVEQDARACELVQRGLHCMRHQHGVLVPQEYGVHEFQQWVRSRLGAGTSTSEP